MTKNINRQTVVVLHNIRSNENVGSMFRTADAAGVSKICLVGYTPAPLDRFGRKNKALAKAALGAEEFVEWESVKSFKALVSKLRSQKFRVIAVEQDKNSIDYRKLVNKEYRLMNKAFIFGNEVTGLSKKELSLCDDIVEIPMKGKKESLNVAVTAGIILFSSLS